MLNRTRICRNACTAGIFMGTATGALHSIVQRKWQDYRSRWTKTGRLLFSMYEKNFRKRWHGVECIVCRTWHSSHAGAGSIKNKEA